MILNEFQKCPYSLKCPNNKNHECVGARSDRLTKFECSFVKQDGTIMEGYRNPNDLTGKMEILSEGN